MGQAPKTQPHQEFVMSYFYPLPQLLPPLWITPWPPPPTIQRNDRGNSHPCTISPIPPRGRLWIANNKPLKIGTTPATGKQSIRGTFPEQRTQIRYQKKGRKQRIKVSPTGTKSEGLRSGDQHYNFPWRIYKPPSKRKLQRVLPSAKSDVLRSEKNRNSRQPTHIMSRSGPLGQETIQNSCGVSENSQNQSTPIRNLDQFNIKLKLMIKNFVSLTHF